MLADYSQKTADIDGSVELGYITCNKKQFTLFICKFFLMLIQKNQVVYHYQYYQNTLNYDYNMT